MSLSLNTRFGSYLVAESIGVGGMGEVYRATDTNLKREVAIKVLPESFAQDADRLARFQREAEVLASLNHVNIATIHGLERSGGVTALVMELVEGPTLAERLEQGPIPVDEALGIAMQIAEALEAAHERGIVHRDLKPANIKLRPDGAVKVLDFGIAKALDNHAGQSGSHSPALTTPAMTEAGVILGTAAYMSPEQARGKKVDQRADIWAFGCVLYEMLTGQPAFGAEDVTTTLARILERSVDLSALPAALSLDARQAIKLCLQKDPKKRVADIRDVKLALTGAFETGAALNGASASSAATAARGRVILMSALALSLAVSAILAIPALRYLRTEALPETRLEIVTPATSAPTEFALSPDGRQIVFVASDENGTSHLWLRSLASTTAQLLVGTESAVDPFWSPNGGSIGFVSQGALKQLDPRGGTPQTLVSRFAARRGSWGADGTLLFTQGTIGPLMRLSAAGGEPTTAMPLGPGQSGNRYPYFLPDGRRFLFYATGSADTAGIYLGNLDGTSPVRLTLSDNAGIFHPAGWLLWVRAGSLTAQRLDLEQAALMGEPLTLAEEVASTPSNSSALSVSATGLIAYRTGLSQAQLTWFDREGTVLGTLGEPDVATRHPQVSPDGTRVAVTRSEQGNSDVWLLDGSRSTRFTFDVVEDSFPQWSPDGSRIVFRSMRSGAGDLYESSSSGAGGARLLLSSDQLKAAHAWSADGQFLIYHSLSPQTGWDLWALPMTGEPEPFVVLQTPFHELRSEFSPDGRWVAYHSDASGRNEVYVRAFAAPDSSSSAAEEGQWQISIAGGIDPVWSPDGQEVYYLDPAGNMVAAPFIATDTTIEVGAPAVLFPTRISGGGTDNGVGRRYDVAPDGRFLINSVESAVDPITLIQNWNPEAAQ